MFSMNKWIHLCIKDVSKFSYRKKLNESFFLSRLIHVFPYSVDSSLYKDVSTIPSLYKDVSIFLAWAFYDFLSKRAFNKGVFIQVCIHDFVPT